MRIKNKWKRNVAIIITLFAVLTSALSPTLTPFALEDANEEFDEKAAEFLDGADEAKDIIGILDDDVEANPDPDRNTINYVMRRLLYLGVYVNNVEDGVLSRDIDKDIDEILYDDKYVCHPNSPGNLIDHNCNIPNFTTGLVQNIVEPFTNPFTNADKTSSYSSFGLGVPNDIPGGVVPVNPNERNHTYTALELYGYNLQLTAYSGEWDQIVVSSSARMLSNFGMIDKITLAGTTIWNSVRAGVTEFIDNFSFNPIRWFGNIASSYEAAGSSGINTVLDTSELNVVATNGWKRPSIDKTLYNVYVLSDREVLVETTRNYFEIFTEELNESADENEELREVLNRDPAVALLDNQFTYDHNWETDESIEDREAAEAQRASEEYHNANERYLERIYMEYSEIDYEPIIIDPLTEIPEPIYYTENEQLGFWGDDDPVVAGILADVRSEGLLSEGSAVGYETYDELLNDWQSSYDPYLNEKFNALGETVSELIAENDADVFQEHPYLDPKQGISKYACANEDGSLMRDEDGSVEYLYEHNNDLTDEHLNPNCLPARAPIGGGLFGTGSGVVIDDTRHVDNVNSGLSLMAQSSSLPRSIVRSLNSLIAKTTNEILGLSFSPLMSRLNIDVIVSNLVESFRDTIFFPLSGLVAAIGAVMLFFQLLKNGSAWHLLISIAGTFLIFIVGATFLLHPSATLNLVEEFPSRMDNVLVNTLLGPGEDSTYCSTDGDGGDAIRSAQCSVWGAMVFEPWVQLQFGTKYDNLYSNGNAPSGGSSFNNTNESLVGDASVNMGNGEIVNNWAMYQLDRTKSGTINQRDYTINLGIVDRDMYRLVDLQAGPDNGAGADSTYFDSWTGANNYGWTVVFLTLIQAIMMSIAIAGLGIAKIEVSFMFSISIIFLPFMLLYALLPKGKIKLKGYIANLVSLLLKRIIIVAMLAILLRVIITAYSSVDDLQTSAMIAIFISLAFVLYRKELLEMITKTEGGGGLINGDFSQIKQAAGQVIPQGAKQKFNVMKTKARGATAGFIGGASGAAEHKAAIRTRKAAIALELRSLNKKDRKGKLTSYGEERRTELKDEREAIKTTIDSEKRLSVKKLDSLEKERVEALERANSYESKINDLYEDADSKGEDVDDGQVAKYRVQADKARKEANEKLGMIFLGERKSNTVAKQAFKGANSAGDIIGRTAERKIRSEGHAPLTAYLDVKDTVYSEGARKITSAEESVEHDTYQEIMSQSKNNRGKTSSRSMKSNERGQLANHPEIQKRVRKIAEERREMVKEDDYKAFTPELGDDVKIAAEIVDKKRKRDKIKMTVTNMPAAIKAQLNDKKVREEAYKSSSSNKHARELIEKAIKKGEMRDKTIVNFKGRESDISAVFLDRERSKLKKMKSKKEKLYDSHSEFQEENEKIINQRKGFEGEDNDDKNEE